MTTPPEIPPLEHRIYALIVSEHDSISRPLQAYYRVDGEDIAEGALTPEQRQTVGLSMLRSISNQICSIADLLRHKKAFDKATVNDYPPGGIDVDPNKRLHAGFLFWMTTDCVISDKDDVFSCTETELLDNFNACMKRTGLFKATVTLDLMRRMLTYAGFTKKKDKWLGLEPCDPLLPRIEFPPFWE